MKHKITNLDIALYHLRILDTAIHNLDWHEQCVWYYLFEALLEGEI